MLTRLSEADIPPDTGDFRLMRRSVVEALLAMPEYHRFVRGMVAWLRLQQLLLRYHRETLRWCYQIPTAADAASGNRRHHQFFHRTAAG